MGIIYYYFFLFSCIVKINLCRETLAKITTDSFISTEEDEDLDPEDAELLDDEDEEKVAIFPLDSLFLQLPINYVAW